MAVGFVQTNTSRINPGTTGTCAFSSNNTGGNLLVCLVYVYASASSITITIPNDSAGNTWTPVNSVYTFAAAGPRQANLFSVSSCKSGPNTVTVNAGTSIQYIIRIIEYNGFSQVDSNAGLASLSNSATVSIGPIVTSQPGDLVILGVSESNNTGTITPGSGYNVRGSGTGLDGLVDQIVGAAGSYTPSWTQVNSNTFSGFAAAFQPASSGGGTSASWLTVNLDNSLRGLRH